MASFKTCTKCSRPQPTGNFLISTKNGKPMKRCKSCRPKQSSWTDYKDLAYVKAHNKRKRDPNRRPGWRLSLISLMLKRTQKASDYRDHIRSATVLVMGSAKNEICFGCEKQAEHWHHYFYDIESIVPVCGECHKKLHTILTRRS